MTDLRIQDEGSLVLLYSETQRGQDWIEDNVAPNEGISWANASRVLEPRYVNDIVVGAVNEGLTVEGL
jgi:hypothetical protein